MHCRWTQLAVPMGMAWPARGLSPKALILLVWALLPAVPALGQGVTLEETVTGGHASTSPVTLPSIQGGSSQTYVLVLATNTNEDVTSVTGGGLTWAERVEQCGSANVSGMRLWTAQGSPGTPFQVQITYDDGKPLAAVLSRYSGVGSIIDATGQNPNGEDGSCTGVSDNDTAQLTLTSTDAGSVHVIGIATGDKTVNSASPGYVLAGSDMFTTGPKTARGYMYEKTFSPAAEDTFQATLSLEHYWATAGVVLGPEVAGVTFTESGGSSDVAETGPTSDTYTIVLDKQPSADVTITVDPDAQTDVGAGAGTAIDLTFTSGDWSDAQTVTVTAVDDSVDEGAHTSTITHTAASADGNYNDIAIANVTANVTDNDTAGVTITQSGGSTDVNEAGPTADTYTVVLNTLPTASVTVTVDPDAQTDLGSGAGVAVGLTFTTGNWNVAQTVTVTAVDDAVAEGAHTSTITHTAASADGNYNDIAIANVTANVTDNDTASVTITQSGGSTDVNEAGPTADTYTVVLNTLPTASVTVTVDPDAQTDLGSGAGVAVGLTFTTGNWNVAQTVTVTAVDDSVDEVAHTSTITHSAASTDEFYNGITIANVTANVTDNDTAGVTITESGGSTDVSESGPTSDTYTIVLDTQPSDDVTITATPDAQSNLGAGAGTAINLTFTSGNWNVAQTVTVTAVDDSVDEVAHTSTITHSAASTDEFYNGITIANVTANVTDNDTAGATITESGGSTDVSESGPTSDTYTIVLDTQPTADVTVTVDPDTQTDLGAGVGTAINLTFTSGDWSAAQTVTVTAVDDGVIEGAHTSTITHSAASSDANYNGIAVAGVTANVADNDTPPVSTPIARSQTVSVDGSGPVEITLSGLGNLGSNPTYTVVSGPSHGTLTGEPPNLVYTPDPNYTGTDSFTYVVDNGGVTSASATVTLEVSSGSDPGQENQPPVADAGSDQTVQPGAEVLLSALESFDPDGDGLRYSWVQISQPLVDGGYDLPYPGPSWSFIAPDVPSTTTYEFELTVTDSGTPAISATDRVVITVAVEPNEPPVAVAGPDQEVSPGESVVLSGEESYDPDYDLPLTFTWTQSGGPAIMDEPIEAQAIEFEAPALDEAATLTFELTVTDNGQPPLSSHTTVAVKVVFNEPPVAVVAAYPDETMSPGDIVVLWGGDSYDPDADLPLKFVWKQIEGPEVRYGSFEGERAEFDVPELEGSTTLVFELCVTDSGLPPRTSKAVARIKVAPTSAAGITRAIAPTMCGVGLPLVLGVIPLVMLVGMRSVRQAVRSAARMLFSWVVEARSGRTFDRTALGKRQHPRWSWDKEVVVRIDYRLEPLRVPTADISEGGIALWFPQTLKVGQKLQVGDGATDAWLEGCVVHVADGPGVKGMYRVGIQFIDEAT